MSVRTFMAEFARPVAGNVHVSHQRLGPVWTPLGMWSLLHMRRTLSGTTCKVALSDQALLPSARMDMMLQLYLTKYHVSHRPDGGIPR